MSHNPLRMLLARLEMEPPSFDSAEVRSSLGQSFDVMVALGFLGPSVSSSSARCDGCGAGRYEEVTWLPDKGTGKRRPYIYCPECGPVEVSIESLEQSRISGLRVLESLRAAASMTGSLEEIVAGKLWSLGRAYWRSQSREVFFVCGYDANDYEGVGAVLQRRPSAVVLTPTDASARRCGSSIPNLVLGLESLAVLSSDGLHINSAVLESCLAERDMAQIERQRRRPAKRASRAINIEKLTKDMIEHLVAARDHAFTSKQQKGTPQLLTRPSQAQLGKPHGLSKSDVSRCINDKTAKQLKIYWETALDINQLMRWKSRRRRRPSS